MDAAQLTQEWPKDLRRAVGERRLVELALEAAQVTGEDLPRPKGTAANQPNPQLFLTLLTYCYASGIYGSEEIEWASQNDVCVHYICGSTFPEAHFLRRFRRANRPWIEACLARVWCKACPVTETCPCPATGARQIIERAIMVDTATADY